MNFRIQHQHPVFRVGIRRPFRKAFSVWIARADEVDKILLHGAAQRSVFRCVETGVFRDVSVEVDFFAAVPASQTAVCLREEIFIGRNLIHRGLFFPDGMTVGKEVCRIDVSPVPLCLRARSGRIKLQHLVRTFRREQLPNLFFIVFQVCLLKENEGFRLLAVESVQLCFLIVYALFIGFPGRFRQRIAIHRHMMVS